MLLADRIEDPVLRTHFLIQYSLLESLHKRDTAKEFSRQGDLAEAVKLLEEAAQIQKTTCVQKELSVMLTLLVRLLDENKRADKAI